MVETKEILLIAVLAILVFNFTPGFTGQVVTASNLVCKTNADCPTGDTCQQVTKYVCVKDPITTTTTTTPAPIKCTDSDNSPDYGTASPTKSITLENYPDLFTSGDIKGTLEYKDGSRTSREFWDNCEGSKKELVNEVYCNKKGFVNMISITCPYGCTTEGDTKPGKCNKAPTCTDKIKNGAETDVDCGGSTCQKCTFKKSCSVNTDCSSGLCENGVCLNANYYGYNCGDAEKLYTFCFAIACNNKAAANTACKQKGIENGCPLFNVITDRIVSGQAQGSRTLTVQCTGSLGTFGQQ